MKVVVAGGSGSLGTRISADLSARGHDVVVLARRPVASSTVRQVFWDGRLLLRIGALVLRTDPGLGLTGRHATSKVLRENGFAFQFGTIDAALTELLG
ncbi:MAG TPA: DUF1731 domain-containing protein [Mycobacterium sp.]